MKKKDKIEKLVLPADPRELVDLYDFRDKIRLFGFLRSNIMSYTNGFLDSFLYTVKDLREAIGEENLHKFKYVPKGFDNRNSYRDWTQDLKPLTLMLGEMEQLTMTRNDYFDREKKPAKFILDTVNKLVYFCHSEYADEFELDEKKNTILIEANYRKHSPTSRAHRPVYMDKQNTNFVIDVKTSELKKVETWRPESC